MTKTSLGDQVQIVFHNLSLVVADEKNSLNSNLLKCWQMVLFGRVGNDPRFYDAMGLIQEATNRLLIQVGESKDFGDKARTVATNAIHGYYQCTFAEHLPSMPSQYTKQLSEERLGAVELAVQTLRYSHSEPAPSDDEIAEIVKDVGALRSTVADSKIDTSLRIILLHQIDVLTWTLLHSTFVGASGVQQCAARVAIVATQLPAQKDGVKSESSKLKGLIGRTLQRIMKVFKTASDIDDGVKAIGDLADVVDQIIDAAEGLGG